MISDTLQILMQSAMAAATPAAAAAAAHAMFIYIHQCITYACCHCNTNGDMHTYVIGHSNTLRIHMYMT